MNEYLKEYLADPSEDWFLINSREEEEIDLRKEIKTSYNEPWSMWLVSYVDEDGEDGSVLLRNAKSAEDALLIGASLVKEHGFIPDQLFYPEDPEPPSGFVPPAW
jgi:hypothetical protein